jgi:hypothetical protein
MKNTDSIQSSILGASGEYLVLSQLLMNNFIAGKAPENTKDYDLIILNKDGTTASPIQVKTTSKPDGWVLSKKHETPIKNLIFFFVYMGKHLSDTEIYIIDSKTVAHAVSNSHAIWLKLKGKNGQDHKDSDMRRLKRDHKGVAGKTVDYTKELNKSDCQFLEDYSEGWLDQYKNAWNKIQTK